MYSYLLFELDIKSLLTEFDCQAYQKKVIFHSQLCSANASVSSAYHRLLLERETIQIPSGLTEPDNKVDLEFLINSDIGILERRRVEDVQHCESQIMYIVLPSNDWQVKNARKLIACFLMKIVRIYISVYKVLMRTDDCML